VDGRLHWAEQCVSQRILSPVRIYSISLFPPKQSMGTRVLLQWLEFPGVDFVDLGVLDESLILYLYRFGMRPPALVLKRCDQV